MKNKFKYIALALPILLASCAEKAYTDKIPRGTDGGLVQVELSVTTPATFLKSHRTRAISEDNETILDGRFAVFGFNDDGGEAGTLLFGTMTGDVNSDSNLRDPDSAWGDYTDTPAIAWHAADAESTSGRLYLEWRETAGMVHLLVLANVDVDSVYGLMNDATADGGSPAAIAQGMSFAEVTAALAPALDYDVTSPDLTSIPMAGECELEEGITLGSKGSVSLRRSMAKFTVRVEYSDERVGEYGGIGYVPFHPESVEVRNLNATFATVWSDYYDGEPNFSILNSVVATPYSPTFSFASGDSEWIVETNSDGDTVYYKEVVFYVAEAENTRADGSRISVLVGGTFLDSDQTTMDECWYRLDLIPASASSSEDEIDCILRNHHYKFVISDDVNRGSTTADAAYALTIPDNFPFDDTSGSGFYVVIEDEDILSVTVEWHNTSDGDVPYYIGVSSTNIELMRAQDACARVKVVTNFGEFGTAWYIDKYNIPLVTVGGDGDGSGVDRSGSRSVDGDYGSGGSGYDYGGVDRSGSRSVDGDYGSGGSGYDYGGGGGGVYSDDGSVGDSGSRFGDSSGSSVDGGVYSDNVSVGRGGIGDSSVDGSVDNSGSGTGYRVYGDNDSDVYAISFVWDSRAETMWLWLDYPDAVNIGDTYAYYIIAGNIRKKMRVTIVTPTNY